jgi:hypothetical protein
MEASIIEHREPVRPYIYPDRVLIRKHAPQYEVYSSFRDWARDDFDFRCAYCLHRETFSYFKSCFDLDHQIPQTEDESLACNYENIVYSCHRCNSQKNKWLLTSPFDKSFGSMLSINEDGIVDFTDDEGYAIVEALGLNDPEFVMFRKKIISLAKVFFMLGDKDAESLWFGIPQNVPDLNTLRPKANPKEGGIDISWSYHRDKWNMNIEPRHPDLLPS